MAADVLEGSFAARILNKGLTLPSPCLWQYSVPTHWGNLTRYHLCINNFCSIIAVASEERTFRYGEQQSSQTERRECQSIGLFQTEHHTPDHRVPKQKGEHMDAALHHIRTLVHLTPLSKIAAQGRVKSLVKASTKTRSQRPGTECHICSLKSARDGEEQPVPGLSQAELPKARGPQTVSTLGIRTLAHCTAWDIQGPCSSQQQERIGPTEGMQKGTKVLGH